MISYQERFLWLFITLMSVKTFKFSVRNNYEKVAILMIPTTIYSLTVTIIGDFLVAAMFDISLIGIVVCIYTFFKKG